MKGTSSITCKRLLPRAILALSASVWAIGFSTPALTATTTSGPAALYAGPVAITPTLALEARYRTNVFLQEDEEVDSWIYLVRPQVIAAVQDRDNFYQLGWRAERSWYEISQPGDDNDYWDNTVFASADMELAERWSARANARLSALHEDRGTGLTEGVIGEFIPEPIEYWDRLVDGTLEYGSGGGSARIEVFAGYQEREYRNFRELTRSRDRNETGLGATFFYPVGNKTDALIEYRYKDIEYPNPFENQPPLDSDENSIELGVDWEITENTRSRAQAGYIKKEFVDKARGDFTGIVWSLNLQMQLREQDRVTIEGRRGTDETSLQGDFIVTETLSATWNHDWSDRVYTSLGGRVGRQTYEGSFNGREDDIYNIDVKANYEFRRWAIFWARYGYNKRNSNVDGLNFDDYEYAIGVDLSL